MKVLRFTEEELARLDKCFVDLSEWGILRKKRCRNCAKAISSKGRYRYCDDCRAWADMSRYCERCGKVFSPSPTGGIAQRLAIKFCSDCGAGFKAMNSSGLNRSPYTKKSRASREEKSKQYSVKRAIRQERDWKAGGLTGYERRKLLALWKRQGKRCYWCSGSCDSVDHVVPIVRGGTHWEGNLVPACRWCNTSRGSRLVVEWRRKPRF